jgi:hypothetical protein
MNIGPPIFPSALPNIKLLAPLVVRLNPDRLCRFSSVVVSRAPKSV